MSWNDLTKEKNMKPITLEDVVEKLLKADTPAYKAHATRSLNAYAEKRALEINSTPKRVIAGVRAVVTKRRFAGKLFLNKV
jgi:hypothetical protein